MYTSLYTHLISATLCDLQAVLRQHSDALRQATLSILKTETLTGQELKDIMAQHPPQDPPRGQVSWAPTSCCALPCASNPVDMRFVHGHNVCNVACHVCTAGFAIASCAGNQEAATICCLPLYASAAPACVSLLSSTLCFRSPSMCVYVVQNGSGPNGGSPDTPDNMSGASEMDTLSTPVLAGPVGRLDL